MKEINVTVATLDTPAICVCERGRMTKSNYWGTIWKGFWFRPYLCLKAESERLILVNITVSTPNLCGLVKPEFCPEIIYSCSCLEILCHTHIYIHKHSFASALEMANICMYLIVKMNYGILSNGIIYNCSDDGKRVGTEMNVTPGKTLTWKQMQDSNVYHTQSYFWMWGEDIVYFCFLVHA